MRSLISPARSILIVPKNIRWLFQKRPLVVGESEKLYDCLVAEMATALKPKCVIDWILLKDLADIQWEIVRYRQCQADFIAWHRATNQTEPEEAPETSVMKALANNIDRFTQLNNLLVTAEVRRDGVMRGIERYQQTSLVRSLPPPRSTKVLNKRTKPSGGRQKSLKNSTPEKKLAP
jgi:hypothetical protein